MQLKASLTILYTWRYGWVKAWRYWVLAGIREGKCTDDQRKCIKELFVLEGLRSMNHTNLRPRAITVWNITSDLSTHGWWVNAKGTQCINFTNHYWWSFHCSSCSEHAWKIRRFDPSKHSIFSLKEEEEEPAYSQLEVEDRDTDQNAKLSFNPVISPEHRSGQHKLLRKTHSAKLGRSFTLCEGNAGPL